MKCHRSTFFLTLVSLIAIGLAAYAPALGQQKQPLGQKSVRRQAPNVSSKKAAPVTISSIALERVPPGMPADPLHPGPWYEVILQANGTVTLYSRYDKFDPGKYQATISRLIYKQQTKRLLDSGFLTYEKFYGSNPPNCPYVVTSIVYNGGHVKSVTKWLDGKARNAMERDAPENLQKIEDSIEAIVTFAHWKKVSQDTDYPIYTHK